jgi:hypothetical protein
MRKPLNLLLTLLIVASLALAGYTWLTLTWTYSSGERAGLLQKFSKKGWLCKTWEGELLLTSMPGAIPEKFEFSVRDESIVDALTKNAGRKVVLTYEQHKGVPSACFGETEYFVTSIVPFKDTP